MPLSICPHSTKDLQSIIHHVVTECIDPPLKRQVVIQDLQNAYDTIINACHSLSTVHDSLRSDDDWLKVNCDLYMSLIVVSYLLILEKKVSKKSDDVLKDSIERSIFMLRILVGAESESELPHLIPSSQYPIFNTLITEPLIPLSREGRIELWLSNNEENKNNDNDDERDTTLLAIPDKKELINEEKQLIQMASRPIPKDI